MNYCGKQAKNSPRTWQAPVICCPTWQEAPSSSSSQASWASCEGSAEAPPNCVLPEELDTGTITLAFSTGATGVELETTIAGVLVATFVFVLLSLAGVVVLITIFGTAFFSIIFGALEVLLTSDEMLDTATPSDVVEACTSTLGAGEAGDRGLG